MTEAMMMQPTIARRLWMICAAKVHRRNAAPHREAEAADETRARRDFIVEMLDRHPQAFRSEMDIQHLARLYRSRF